MNFGFLNEAGDKVVGTLGPRGGATPVGSYAREVRKVGTVPALGGFSAADFGRLKVYPIQPGAYDAATEVVTARTYQKAGALIDVSSGSIVEVLTTSPIPQAELDARAAVVLENSKANAVRAVNVSAEVAREAWITPGAGQAMSYREKAAEADDAVANHDAQNPPTAGKYPLLESEVPAKGADVLAVATLVAATRDQWKAIEAQINRTRVEAIDAIAAAAAPVDVDAVLAGLAWPAPGV